MQQIKAPTPFLALAATLVVMGITIISPAITILRDEFAINAERAQMILSFFLFAVAFGQFICGPISDYWGRRPTLMIGTLLFTIGAFASTFAPTIELLYAARFIQGLGGACCISMSRAMVNDCYNKQDAARELSFIAAMMAIVPMICIGVGGILVNYLGWRFNMGITAGAGLLLLILSFFYAHETNHHRVDELRFRRSINIAKQLFHKPLFVYNLLISAIQTGIFYAMNGFLPYHYYKLGASPTEFGLWFCLTSVGYMAGSIVNRRLAKSHPLERIIIGGSVVSLFALILMGILPVLYAHPVMLAIPGLLFGFSNGTAISNAMIAGMSVAGKNVGTAIGLLGACQVIFGGMAGALIIMLGGEQHLHIGVLVVGALAVLSVWASVKAYVRD